MFTCRDVEAGEELCFSYFGDGDDTDDEEWEKDPKDGLGNKAKGKKKNNNKSTLISSPVCTCSPFASTRRRYYVHLS